MSVCAGRRWTPFTPKVFAYFFSTNTRLACSRCGLCLALFLFSSFFSFLSWPRVSPVSGPVDRLDAIKMYTLPSLSLAVFSCVPISLTRLLPSAVQFFACLWREAVDDSERMLAPLPLFPSGCFKQTHTSLSSPLLFSLFFFFFLLSIT